MDIFYLTLKNQDFSLKYMLSLLNSKLIYYWLEHNCKKKGNMFELIQKPLSPMPIRKIDQNNKRALEIIVDKILALTQTDDYLENQEKQDAVKKYENQIDIMVYKLYDLTYSEVKTIDPNFSMTEQEYNNYTI